MSKWHCYTCKEPVKEIEIETEFMEQQSDHEGLVCLVCNEKWLTEEVVTEEIAQSEADAEAKMA